MTAQLKLVTPNGYRALTPETVLPYLAGVPAIAAKLGGAPAAWTAREVGDGNLNLVFIVEGSAGAVVAKQALPYVRLVGESWPLPLSRAHFEHLALVEQAIHASQFVPEIYYYDADMALTVMEYLTPHIILRKGLIQGITYPKMAVHLGQFLADTLFNTSDLKLSAPEKKQKMAQYLDNTAMCKISEDLIFDEPYFNAPLNRHTTPQLDDISVAFQNDAPLKAAVQAFKWKFLNQPEALLHADLHTGSVMVTNDDTRAIDPEFAFYGPMGFDIGAVIANLILSGFAQDGYAGDRTAYKAWVFDQIAVVWNTFAEQFAKNWRTQASGDAYQTRLYGADQSFIDLAIAQRLSAIWADTVGFAACKTIRRILGLAHVEDMEVIGDADTRAACERRALQFARDMLLAPQNYSSAQILVQKGKQA